MNRSSEANMPLTEKELMERDAKRNIGEELLQAVLEVKAGRFAAVHEVETNAAKGAEVGAVTDGS